MNKNITILVADDDENDLQMILDALANRGTPTTVFTVRDGAEALDFLRNSEEFKTRESGNPRFLLLDLNMPRVDGWDVLRQIKSDAALKTMPVVIFTSSNRDRDVRECYRLGANAYVVKPSDCGQFAIAIQEIHAFWTGRNEPPPVANSYADTATN